jgi:hypothetical protein
LKEIVKFPCFVPGKVRMDQIVAFEEKGLSSEGIPLDGRRKGE